MKLIVTGRQGGKTTELFEWLARGEVIETEYLGDKGPIWSRGIVTTTEERRNSTRRFLQRWVRMQSAYRDATEEMISLLLDAVYSLDVVQEGRGRIWNPMREGRMGFAMDDADTALEHYLGVPISVATFSGEAYEREDREINAIVRPWRLHDSTEDELTFSRLRKGFSL